MLLSAFLSTIVSSISTGTLYTAFLAAYDFSIADTTFLSVIPSLAACFCILSPIFLERFQKRRWLLAGGWFVYHLLNQVGLTLLAIFVKTPTARLWGFSAILLSSNLIHSLFSSGYSVWHLNFIPVQIRAKHLSYQQIITTIASVLSLFFFGLLADALKGTDHEATVLTIMRIVAFIFALVELAVLCIPKEYPYPREEKTIRLSNIIRLPLRHKSFVLTMTVIALWNFIAAFPSSAWTYHLLESVGTGVTVVNLFHLFSAVCLITTPFWRNLIHRLSWFRTFAICALLNVPAVFMMAFVDAGNYQWLYVSSIFIQALVGIGLNLAWYNLPFVNTPPTDQTYYLAFYTLTANLGLFLGNAAGAWFVRVFPDLSFPMFGKSFETAPLMILIQCVMYIFCAFFILSNLKTLHAGQEH